MCIFGCPFLLLERGVADVVCVHHDYGSYSVHRKDLPASGALYSGVSCIHGTFACRRVELDLGSALWALLDGNGPISKVGSRQNVGSA